jgi:DNA polymerase I-like protein with 3'-5' exonuclease and polymerase domains
MQIAEKVNYTCSNKLYTIMTTLNNLAKNYSILGCDFESCSRWSDEEKEEMKQFLEDHPETDREEKRQIKQFIESDGLSHPSLTYITHFQVAWSPNDSFVAILDTEEKRKRVFNWIINTEVKQLWHNLSFDGKHIMYHTGKLPKNYEDTEILAKTLLNHVNTFEAKTSLKHLMGYRYGDWAISADSFNISQIYDKNLIKYAATDSTATYALWEEMQESLKEKDE